MAESQLHTNNPRLSFTLAEIEDLIWQKCAQQGYRTRPEHFTYLGGRPSAVEVEVQASDLPPEPTPEFLAFIRRTKAFVGSCVLKESDSYKVAKRLAGLKPEGYLSVATLAFGITYYRADCLMRDLLAAGYCRFESCECPECHEPVSIDPTERLFRALECANCDGEILLVEDAVFRWVGKEQVHA